MADDLSISLEVKLDEGSLSSVQSKLDKIKTGKDNKINIELNQNINSQIANLKKSITSITNKPYKIDIQINQQIVKDMKSLTDELNKAASNLQRYKANTSATTGARNTTAATPSSKTGSVGSGYPNVGLLSSKFVDDVAVSRLKKINQELGKTHTIIQELDEDGNVTKTIDKYTNNLDLQVKALEKTKDILSKRQSDLNEKAADAFKRNEPLTDSFAKPVEDQIDRIQTKIDGLKSSGLVASAKDIRELNEEFRKLDTLIKDQHALQYPNTKLKSVDTRESVERYISALNQLENKQKSMGLLTTEMQTNIETIRNGFASVGNEDGGALDKWVDKFGTLKQKIDEFASSTQGKGLRLAFNIDENELQKLTNLTENEVIKSGTTPGIEKLRENINILKNEYANISEQLKSEDLTDAQFSALSARLDELKDKFTQVAGAAKVYQDGFKNEQAIETFKEDQKILALQLDRVQQKYNEIKSANKDLADPALEQQLLSLKNKIENVDPTNIGLVRKELQEVRTAVNGLQPPMQSFSQLLSQNFGGLGQYLSRFASTTYIIGKVVSTAKKMVSEVKSIDTSLVELQKVTGLAGNALDEFTDKAYNVGKGLGRTGQDVIDATTTFSRAGYDLQEATELAQSALVMTNVGVDIPNMESAASDMISILKAFDKQADESMSVIDKLYNVANKEPLDFGNITQMLVTAGGTLAQTGTTLEETMGLLTGGFATLRDTSVANGLIMISQRLRGVNEEGEALEADFVPKLKKAFGDVGISIEDQNGELKSTFDILDELAAKWDTLSSKQKQFLGEKAAGNRQVKTLNAIMANWDVVQETIDNANNSAGAAMEGNKMFMESIEGRIVQLKSAFQDLARTTINSDFIKWTVSFGTSILSLTKNIGGLIPVITTISGLVAAFNATKIQKAFKGIKDGLSFTRTGIGIGSVLGKLGLFISAITILSGVIKKISDSISLFNKIGDAKNKYQAAIDSMNSAQSQLTGVRERISQIKSLGELSFVEEQELAKLEKTSAQLELQYETQKNIAEVQKQMAESSFGALMSNFAGYTSGYGGIDALNSVAQWFGNSGLGKILGEDLRLFGIDIGNEDWGKPDKQLFEEAINAFTNAQTEITRANQDIYNNMYNGLADGIVDQAVQDNKERRLQAFTDFSKAMSILERYKAASEGIERNSITEPFFQEIDAMETALSDAMQYALDLDDALITPFQEILSSSEFSNVSSELINLAESGQLTNESFSNVDGVDAFLNAIGKLGISTEQAVGFLNELYSEAESQPDFIMPERVAAEAFTTTDAYKTLTAAMQEQQKAGVLSSETWAKLTSAESGLPRIAECLELSANGYVLNTEKVYDYIEAQNQQAKLDAVRGLRDQTEELERLRKEQEKLTYGSEEWNENIEKQNGIQAEIDRYSALIREIDSATDALSRYNHAKQTSNEDANFNIGQSAFKDIEEGLKSGKIGTDDFKTAVDYVLGDNWEEDFARFGGDADKAYKEAKKLGERYFGGKDEKKNAENFQKDLVKAGFAVFEGDQFKLVDGTLEEMATALGISEEAARDLFGLLNTYGGNFKFSEILTDQDLENLKQLDTKEAQKALDGLKKKREELAEEQKNTEAGSDEFKQLGEEINNADKAISVLQENIDSGGNIAEGLSLTDAIAKLAELQETIETLNTKGIDIPVQLQNQYEELKGIVDRLSGNGEGGSEGLTNADNTLTVTYSGEVDESVNETEKKLDDVARDRPVNYTVGEVELPTVDNEFSKNAAPKDSTPFAGLSGHKALLAYQMAELVNGNVDLANRPVISAHKLSEAGWSNAGDGTATIYSSGYNIGENGEIGIMVTPILPNGEVLSPEQLDKAVDDLLVGPDGKVDINSDPLGILIDQFDYRGKSKKEIEDWENKGDLLHQLQELFYSNDETQFEFGDKNDEPVDVSVVDVDTGSGNGFFPEGFGTPTEGDPFSGKKQTGAPDEWTWNFHDNTPDKSGQKPSTEIDIVFPSDEVDSEAKNAIEEAQNVADDNPVELTFGNSDKDPIVGLGKEVEALHGVASESGATSDAVSNLASSYIELSNARREYNRAVASGESGEDELAGYQNSLSNFVKAFEQIKSELSGTDIDFDFSGVQEKIAQLSQEVTSADMVAPVDADTSAAQKKIGALDSAATTRKTKPVGVDTSGAYSEIDALERRIQTPVVKPMQVQQRGELFAKGIKRSKKGTAVVDENGAELIEHVKDGTFELGTNDGARFVTLNEGDVVHTAEETKKILSRNGKKGEAFASGTGRKGLFGAIVGAVREAAQRVATQRASDFAQEVRSRVAEQQTRGPSSSTRPVGSSPSIGSTGSGRSGGGSGGSGGGHSSGSSSSSSGDSEFRNWLEKLFDWVEIRLAKLKKATDAWIQAAGKAINYKVQNSRLDKAIESIKNEIDATRQAYDEYMHTADEVAQQAGLTADVIEKIQNGTIDVESLDKDMQEKIRAYQEWYERAQDCRTALADLEAQEQELAKQKLDNIISYFDSRTSVIDSRNQVRSTRVDIKQASGKVVKKKDYQTQINADNKKLKLLAKEKTALENELNSSSIRRGSQEWYEYQNRLIQIEQEMAQTELSMQELNNTINQMKLDKLSKQFDQASGSISQYEKRLQLLEAQGKSIKGQKTIYESLIATEKSQITNLNNQNRELNKLLEGVEVGSDAYYEYTQQINDNEIAIMDARIAIEEYQDAIANIDIQLLENKLQSLASQADITNQKLTLNEAAGGILNDRIRLYDSLISNTKDRIAVLTQEIALEKQQSEGLSKTSQEYVDLTQSIAQHESEILSLQTEIVGYQDAIDDISLQKLENALQELTDKADIYTSKLDLWQETGKAIDKNAEAYSNLIDNYQQQIDLLYQEIELDKQRREGLAKSSQKYVDLSSDIRQHKAEIVQLQTTIAQYNEEMSKIQLTKLGWQLDELANKAKKLNLKNIDFRKALGLDVTPETYNKLIENGMEQIDILKAENQEYYKLREGLDENSEKYQEYTKMIHDNNDAIWDLKIQQEEWNDAILDLKIDKLTKFKDSLSKVNDQYKRQKELQEALEDLQRAQDQRTVRVYREGTGFVYEADQEEVKSAQEKLEDVIEDQLLSRIDDLIDALEESKDDTNIYDQDGHLLGTRIDPSQMTDLQSILNNYYQDTESYPEFDWLKSYLGGSIVTNASKSATDLSFNGNIIVNGADDVKDFANKIVSQLPNAMLQALSNKTA